MNRPLEMGERLMLIDRKGRSYLVRAEPGGEWHSHAGVVSHEAIVDAGDGGSASSTKGAAFRVLRPTLADFVLKMKRGAQVIYPKDLGPILVMADIFPGARVFESGVGSGALSMTMLRAGASITGYEIRDDFARRARKNVEDFLGSEALDRYDIQNRSSYDGIDENDFDRVVLDLPEPWNVVSFAQEALRPGGIFLAYLPSVSQVMSLHEALDASDFDLAVTTEVLNRTWKVEGAAVRPNHRMVAHTGFLTTARLFQPGSRDRAIRPR